ncbi:MAG: lipid-A-disaccharide synthase N-terminal domain-containing protein [Pseudomonadota bacterium]
MAGETHWLMDILLVDTWPRVWLAIFGLTAQGIFMSRMLIQWIATERAKRSVMPVSFWWLSLIGAIMLLIYGILDRDIVIIAAQAFGFIVYARNLWFIHVERRGGAETDP